MREEIEKKSKQVRQMSGSQNEKCRAFILMQFLSRNNMKQKKKKKKVQFNFNGEGFWYSKMNISMDTR